MVPMVPNTSSLLIGYLEIKPSSTRIKAQPTYARHTMLKLRLKTTFCSTTKTPNMGKTTWISTHSLQQTHSGPEHQENDSPMPCICDIWRNQWAWKHLRNQRCATRIFYTSGSTKLLRMVPPLVWSTPFQMGSIPTLLISHSCWRNRWGTNWRTQIDMSRHIDNLATLSLKMENMVWHSQFSDIQVNTFKHEQLIQHIQALYTMKPILLQHHQYVLTTMMIEERDSQSTTQLSEWKLKHNPVTKACLNTAKLQLMLKSSDIRKFYPSTAKLPATITSHGNAKNTNHHNNRNTNKWIFTTKLSHQAQ